MDAGAELVDSFTLAAQNSAAQAATMLPLLLMALIVFVLGWVIAVILGRIVGSLLKALKLEDFLKSHMLEDAFGTVRISDILVQIVKYYVLLIFLQAAVSLVQLDTLSAFLSIVLYYAPKLISGFLVLVAAVLFGEYAKETIKAMSKSKVVQTMARAAKVLIVYVGLTMALSTAGIDTTLLNFIFMILLSALAFGIALAMGIAFGLGGQSDAKGLIGSWRKALRI